jgi:organic radical activating enzyme
LSAPNAFPILSDTACLLKWGWSTLFLYSGKSNSCHRTTLSEVDPNDIGTFHNTPAKIEQREIMRNGAWPERGNGCEYCRDIEEAGGMSDRKTNLALLDSSDDFKQLIPPELLINPQALAVTPTMLEVYFTNRCNMACIYCGPNYSTQWLAENKRFGTPDHLGGQISWKLAESLDKQYPARLKQFWQWMEQHSGSLRMFHVLGGEPFYQAETEQAIRFWYDHPNPHLHLKIFSNLKVAKSKLEYLMGELKKLTDGRRCKSVGIIASADCWGREQEYLRSGLDLQSWTENFEYLVSEHRWANISINSTINVLSVKTMPDLLRRMRVWSDQRSRPRDAATAEQISTVFNMLMGPPFMHAGILPGGFFDREFQEIVALLPRRSTWELANVEYMQGIWKTVNATPHNPQLIGALKAYLDEIDHRRQSDWRTTFPWLAGVS